MRMPCSTARNKALFTQNSYRCWAMEEIENYITQNESMPITDLLEDFRRKMDHFACDARTPHARFMFSVAYDVVTDMLDKEISK